MIFYKIEEILTRIYFPALRSGTQNKWWKIHLLTAVHLQVLIYYNSAAPNRQNFVWRMRDPLTHEESHHQMCTAVKTFLFSSTLCMQSFISPIFILKKIACFICSQVKLYLLQNGYKFSKNVHLRLCSICSDSSHVLWYYDNLFQRINA